MKKLINNYCINFNSFKSIKIYKFGSILLTKKKIIHIILIYQNVVIIDFFYLLNIYIYNINSFFFANYIMYNNQIEGLTQKDVDLYYKETSWIFLCKKNKKLNNLSQTEIEKIKKFFSKKK